MADKKHIRIVLITSRSDRFMSELVSRLKGIHNVEFNDVIYWNARKKPYLKRIAVNIKKHGLIYVAWRTIVLVNDTLIKKSVNLLERLMLVADEKNDLGSACSRHGLGVTVVERINDDKGAELIRSLGCDLLVVCGTKILKEPVFTASRYGTVNLHMGDSTKYRGMPPGFWELWNGEREAGVTIHFVDEGIDTGGIIIQEKVPIFEDDNLDSLTEKLSEVALRLLPRAVSKIADGEAKDTGKTPGTGRFYRRPSLKERFTLALKLKRRRLRLSSPARGLVKKAIYPSVIAYVILRDAYLLRKGRNVLSVLYYHRVTNICKDGMTIGVKEFERHIRFLKRHYHILTPSELLSWINKNNTGKGKKAVVITFDDGYRDNYLNALPVLKKYLCPAFFFISTGLVGNKKQFEHDSWIQPQLTFEKMSWDEIREARNSNIEIGVHSHTHANLGKIGITESIKDIETSIEEYSRNLGPAPVFMSYPFGGKGDITTEVIDYIKKNSRILALFSAYGDKNISPFDRYDIKRINIGSWENTLLTFWVKVEGGIRTIFNLNEVIKPMRTGRQKR